MTRSRPQTYSSNSPCLFDSSSIPLTFCPTSSDPSSSADAARGSCHEHVLILGPPKPTNLKLHLDPLASRAIWRGQLTSSRFVSFQVNEVLHGQRCTHDCWAETNDRRGSIPDIPIGRFESLAERPIQELPVNGDGEHHRAHRTSRIGARLSGQFYRPNDHQQPQSH